MNVAIFGAGYLGHGIGACLPKIGNDVDARKVDTLRRGEISTHEREHGRGAPVHSNAAAGRLTFAQDATAAWAHGTMQTLGVGTPPNEDGSADLQYVLAAARSVGRLMTDYKVVVDNSTVPVGAADQVRQAIAEELSARGEPMNFAVVGNPEFRKEGAAIDDLMGPGRLVVGSDDDRTRLLLRALYLPFMRNNDGLVLLDVRGAEFTQYAANAMLATRIRFMNGLARLADAVGATLSGCAKASAAIRASARTSCSLA